jgi:hypothetical protein
LSLIPAFPQCWRRYFEEGRERVHLSNAGKYFSAMVAVTFRLWYLNSSSRAGLVLGVLAAVVATLFQSNPDSRPSPVVYLRPCFIFEHLSFKVPI